MNETSAADCAFEMRNGVKWDIYKIKNHVKDIILYLLKMRGLKSVILGSFMVGSGCTLLLYDIWLKNNKYYKIVKIK